MPNEGPMVVTTNRVRGEVRRPKVYMQPQFEVVLSEEELDRALKEPVLCDDGWEAAALLGALALLVGAAPLAWAGFAFAFRGGVSLWLAGLALVGRDGRPAPRWRCGLRELLVWLPAVALLWPVFWVDLFCPHALWLCSLFQGLAGMLLVGYVVLALRFPRRSPQDRLAGTYLVPQ
jgi:hypothetical protein